MRARARCFCVVCLLLGDFFFRFFFVFFTSLRLPSTVNPSFFEVLVEEDKEETEKTKKTKKTKKTEEENDDEDIIIIIEAAAVALQKVLDEIVFSCHRRVDSFDVLGCAELRATTRTKTKSDDNDEGGE